MSFPSRVEFDVQLPVDNEGLRANVRHALGLRLPELRDFEYPRPEQFHIVANGPSARRLDGSAPVPHTCALNGALGIFDAPPMYWAACDPQPMVADFLAPAVRDTVFLVASKCHPSVFEVLAGKGITPVLWHVWEEPTAGLLEDRLSVGAGVSITNTVFELGAHLGYRRFVTTGWDGCYGPDGAAHANGPSPPPADLKLWIGDRSWPSCPAWALEAQDAAARLVGFPFPIHVNGDGFMGAYLSLLLPNRVTTDTDKDPSR